MLSAKITQINKEHSQVDNSDYLDVTVEFSQDDQVKDTKRFGFALDASADSIKEEVSKLLSTYEDDLRLAEESAKKEAAEASANTVIEELTGTQFTIQSTTLTEAVSLSADAPVVDTATVAPAEEASNG